MTEEELIASAVVAWKHALDVDDRVHADPDRHHEAAAAWLVAADACEEADCPLTAFEARQMAASLTGTTVGLCQLGLDWRVNPLGHWDQRTGKQRRHGGAVST